MRFLTYNPDQAYLLPPSVKDELGEGHLCFFIHQVVERLDLREFERGYGEEGRAAYAPALMVKVWLYAYALQVTSSRRLEQRVREDLAFRYLAGGAKPDHWTLNDFRTRHRRAINDVFLQVVEVARGLGMGKLGHVAIDSTRVKANASTRRMESKQELRQGWARTRREIRRWQQQCDAADPNEEPGTQVDPRYGGENLVEVAARRARLRRCIRMAAMGIRRTTPKGNSEVGFLQPEPPSVNYGVAGQPRTRAAEDGVGLGGDDHAGPGGNADSRRFVWGGTAPCDGARSRNARHSFG